MSGRVRTRTRWRRSGVCCLLVLPERVANYSSVTRFGGRPVAGFGRLSPVRFWWSCRWMKWRFNAHLAPMASRRTGIGREIKGILSRVTRLLPRRGRRSAREPRLQLSGLVVQLLAVAGAGHRITREALDVLHCASDMPLQLLSKVSHTSVASGWTAGRPSSQSPTRSAE